MMCADQSLEGPYRGRAHRHHHDMHHRLHKHTRYQRHLQLQTTHQIHSYNNADEMI